MVLGGWVTQLAGDASLGYLVAVLSHVYPFDASVLERVDHLFCLKVALGVYLGKVDIRGNVVSGGKRFFVLCQKKAMSRAGSS